MKFVVFIHSFAHVESSLHARDKSHLPQVNDLSGLLLELSQTKIKYQELLLQGLP